MMRQPGMAPMRLDDADRWPVDAPFAARSAGWGSALLKIGRLKLVLLDLAIGLARKTGGFVALLTLGWTYFRLLALGQPLAVLYPGAPDPDLRQTLWVALLLILAQGWDIPTDRLAADWQRLREQLPARAPTIGFGLGALGSAARTPVVLVVAPVAPVVVRLGRFMDLCVAIANKLGALAALAVLLLFAWQMGVEGLDARALYPQAHDPAVSLLADLCVAVVVLGWWGMPLGQVAVFWRRLRGSDEPAG